METIVILCNTAAVLSVFLYATWSLVLFDIGHPTVGVPILNIASMMIPVGLFYRPPPNMRPVDDFLFCCFAIVTSMMTTILTLSWWMGRFATTYPDPPTMINGPHDEARSFISILATIGAICGLGVSIFVKRNKTNTKRTRKGKVFRFLRVASWIVAVRELFLAAYMVAYPTPLVATVDSASAVIISAVVSWLVVPDIPALLAIPYFGYGVGLSVSTWVSEIRRTETFADYLSVKAMKVALEEGRLVGVGYSYSGMDVDYCCAMSLSYQLSTIYWLALGMALLVGVIPVPEKRVE